MRRTARELALQILFQIEYTPHISITHFLELFESQIDADSIRYAELLVAGVQAHLQELDALISAKAMHWKLDRIALIDKNILRIAIYEMKFSTEKIPPQVAINEAVEIARKFSNTDSPGFVNGVLDNISKS